MNSGKYETRVMINIDEGNVIFLENFFFAPVNLSARC